MMFNVPDSLYSFSQCLATTFLKKSKNQCGITDVFYVVEPQTLFYALNQKPICITHRLISEF